MGIAKNFPTPAGFEPALPKKTDAEQGEQLVQPFLSSSLSP